MPYFVAPQTMIECSICLEPVDDAITVFKCKHTLHYRCFKEWMKTCERQNNPCTCPCCRGTVAFSVTMGMWRFEEQHGGSVDSVKFSSY